MRGPRMAIHLTASLSKHIPENSPWRLHQHRQIRSPLICALAVSAIKLTLAIAPAPSKQISIDLYFGSVSDRHIVFYG